MLTQEAVQVSSVSRTLAVLKEPHRFRACLLHEVSTRDIEQNKNDYFALFTSPTGTAHWSGSGAAMDLLATVSGLFDGPCVPDCGQKLTQRGQTLHIASRGKKHNIAEMLGKYAKT